MLELGQGQSLLLELEQGLSLVLELGQGQTLLLELEQGLSLVLELKQGLSLVLELEQGLSLVLELEQGLSLVLFAALPVSERKAVQKLSPAKSCERFKTNPLLSFYFDLIYSCVGQTECGRATVHLNNALHQQAGC